MLKHGVTEREILDEELKQSTSHEGSTDAGQSVAYVDRSVVDGRAEHGEVDHGAELLKSVLETRSSRS
jgi:hypothetical protein